MKDLIILIAMILLGLFLYDLVAGPQDSSIYSAVKNVWVREAEARTMNDTPR